MAGTTQAQINLTVRNDNFTHSYVIPQKSVSQTNPGVFDRIVNVSTTEVTVEFTGITTPGLTILQNLSTSTTTTDYVMFGSATGDPIGNLPPNGLPAIIPQWDASETLYLDANNSTCNVRVIVHEA